MPNRLASETSPYLLQHADNPVDWQPWDDEALEAAKAGGKPILLSIGYSSCHWCHVMAHESFEDPTTAAVMNQHFVNIKVDREERPDLDKIYQSALQLLSPQGGGWPLTMFLDPETLLPFFGGTYFPKTPRYQLPGFSDLLMRISETFTTKKDELSEQGTKLAETMKQMITPVLDPTIEDGELLQKARDQLDQQYDSQEGGFGKAPKFPMPGTLQRILNHWAYTRRSGGNDRAGLEMVMITLTQMARGGIYDHLGGGFCRYATDRKWMIPHFEKMLYDNGQLLSLYSYALKFGTDELFEQAIGDTISWLTREMRHPEGGFFSALDADSEGQEGKYYVWRREQVKKVLTEEEYLVVETLYGLDKPANFENKWNLHRYDSWRSVVDRLSLERDEANRLLASARSKLLDARGERIRPGTDDKVLTSWNALTVRGLVHAADQMKREDWLDLATTTIDFLRENLWDNGVLHATWKDGQRRFPGYLDDYATLLDALTESLAVSWRDQDLIWAIDIADALIEKFYDNESGGFYFTSHDHETLIHRPKPTMDEALPPGNGTAAVALMKLGHLLARTDYLDAAHNTLRWARAIVEQVPSLHCTLLSALEMTVYPPQQVVLRGPAEETAAWRSAIEETYAPWLHVYCIGYDSTGPLPSYLPRLVSIEQQSKVTAFVCSGLQCSLPIENLEELQAELNRGSGA